ncbi:hypothetical protein ACB092_11G175300 [Castanea dentata]
MMPVYRYMDSQPHQFTQYHHPGLEAMKSDPSNPNLPRECWPHGGNYGYPMPWHSCCNHNSFPGYYSFRPPYPHFPPPSPMSCCGIHPTYHESYPIHYVPPPHYSMEMPRYEYDKNVPAGNYHCCGCPNHAHNQKDDRIVKIVEQEPEAEKKRSESESMVPVQDKNFPYPIVWIPPESMQRKEQKKPFECEIETGESDKVPAPPAMNSLGTLLHSGDGKRTQNQQNEEKRTQFPFPIIWMPYDKEEAENKEKEPPYTFKFIPVNPPQSHELTNVLTANEKISESQGDSEVSLGENAANQENIPVKQVEFHKEEGSEDTQSRGRSGANTMDKPPCSKSEKQTSSPPKMSKLPPVCLRVDPLPRKKNGNSSSRSPSPPAHSKEASNNDTSLATAASSFKKKTPQVPITQDSSKKVEPNKKIKVIEVVDRKTSEDQDRNLRGGSEPQFPFNPLMGSQEKSEKDGKECKVQESRKEGDMKTEEQIEAKKEIDSSKLAGDEGKFKKKTLSEEEAAVLIQSAYHGYEVRKWEPLKKLRQLAEVRQQVADVQNQIQVLESSSDLQRDDKQKVVIGETIMRILLKLDTIQGLHPIVRDLRKSLARELVSLQDKLDSLMINKSEESIEEVSTTTTKHMEQHTVETSNSLCLQEEEAEEVAGFGESSPEGNCNSKLGMVEAHESMLCPVSSLQSEETSGSTFTDTSIVVPKEAEPEQIMEQKDEVLNCELNVCQEALKDVENENIVYSEQSSDLPLVEEEKIKSEMEFTPGGTDENPTVYESDKDNQIGTGQSEVESNMSVDATSQTQVDLMGTDERRGVFDDGPAASEFERHEQLETGGEGKCNVTVNVISPDDETQTVSQLEQQALDIHEEEKSIPGDATLELAVESPPKLRESNEAPTWENKDNDEQPLVAIGEEKKVEEEAEHESQDEKVLIDQVIGFEIVEDNDEQPLVAIGGEKKEAEEAKNESQNNKVLIDRAIGSEIESEEVPLHLEIVEGEGEPLPLSPTASQVSVDECNIGVESDKKLIEENKKLREMMEELIAAGKEQLTVISNLTVRVRDLEKQLARKKKLRRKPASSRSSCFKPANKALKERAIGVAM